MNLFELRELLIQHCIDSGGGALDENHCSYCAAAVLVDKVTTALVSAALERRA